MRKKCLFILLAVLVFLSAQPVTVFAVTREEIEAVGKETAAGNIFIWFLCAIAFLKISQKIDSFMSSLGINVGHTGGSMMAELMIAARGVSVAKTVTGGSFTRGSYRGSNSAPHTAFMSGGLAGVVGRHFGQSAMSAMTGQGNNPIGRMAFESSLRRGGEFANSITGAVAQGSINYTGSMTGEQAAQALVSYMGQTGMENVPSYSNVEIGGGRIMGTEISVEHPDGAAFGMYNTEQYMAPEGSYETVTAADNTTWYRQYATDAVERTPYMTGDGSIAYRESIVQRLPEMPRRKERV